MDPRENAFVVTRDEMVKAGALRYLPDDIRPLAVRFELGRLCITVGAAMQIIADQIRTMLTRHASGDWGHLAHEDRDLNDVGLRTGGQLMSAYAIEPSNPCKGYGDNTIWVITEADRSATTVLLPREY